MLNPQDLALLTTSSVILLVIKILLLVLPVKMAASFMDVRRPGVLWCLLALVLATFAAPVAYYIPFFQPTLGHIMAFLFAAGVFGIVLGAGPLAAVVVAALYVLFAWLIKFAIVHFNITL